MLTAGVREGGCCGGQSYEFSQLSVQLWVSDIVFYLGGVGGAGVVKKKREVGGGVRRLVFLEPTGLNSTAEPLTPTIHQCRGVTRLGQEYVTGGGTSPDCRAGDGARGLRGL